MIEAELRAFWLNDSEITALVGQRILTRRPQKPSEYGGFPAITIQRIDTVRPRHLRGPTGFPDARVQVTCVGNTQQDAKNLADKLRTSQGGGSLKLESFSGTLGSHVIQRIAVGDERDFDESPSDASEQARFVTQLDLMIKFGEVV